MGDILILALPLVILIVVVWGLSTALKPRDPGMSDAERYQQVLAAKSAEHDRAQVRAAMEAHARIAASTRPSQNTASATEQQQSAAARSIHQGNPGAAQLNPQLLMQLQGMVRGGQKIQAIKLLRQATHLDLANAKKYIDRL